MIVYKNGYIIEGVDEPEFFISVKGSKTIHAVSGLAESVSDDSPLAKAVDVILNDPLICGIELEDGIEVIRPANDGLPAYYPEKK